MGRLAVRMEHNERGRRGLLDVLHCGAALRWNGLQLREFGHRDELTYQFSLIPFDEGGLPVDEVLLAIHRDRPILCIGNARGLCLLERLDCRPQPLGEAVQALVERI